jgi:F-type H+-transporting ATPase subunit delta
MTAAKGESSFEASFDVRSQEVARVYAEALLNAADKQGKVDSILEQLATLVHDLFQSQPLIEKFLASGAIKRHAKQEALQHAFDGITDPLLLDFLQVLNNHDRLGLLRAVWACYREKHDERARRMRVKVRAAAPLSAEQETRLKKELQDTFALEPILDIRIDENLLGGLIVQVGDWLFDGTVRSRLDRIRNQLMASSNYVQDRRDQFSFASGN